MQRDIGASTRPYNYAGYPNAYWQMFRSASITVVTFLFLSKLGVSSTKYALQNDQTNYLAIEVAIKNKDPVV